MVPVMIGKDYFKRQAKTLRKMVKVVQDPVVAERLCEMADEFESRADAGLDERMRFPERAARGDEGHG
jgi:pyoverdine/dityrosine biosynthesis protein Dit1